MHVMNKPLIALIMVLDVILLLSWAGWDYIKKPREMVSVWTFKLLVFGSAIALCRAFGADWDMAVLISLAIAGISPTPRSDMLRTALMVGEKQD